MWFQVVVDRRADTAAVSAMADGSQHRTIKAMSPADCTVGISVDRIEMTPLHAAVHYKILKMR
jgi:hypothetical protein